MATVTMMKIVEILLITMVLSAVVAGAGIATSTGRCNLTTSFVPKRVPHVHVYSARVIKSTFASCEAAKKVVYRTLSFIVYHGGQGNGDFFTPIWWGKWCNVHCWANGGLNNSSKMHVRCKGPLFYRVNYIAMRVR
jgi:hypothetical protein